MIVTVSLDQGICYSISNGAVTGAPAEIPAQLLVHLGRCLEILTIISFEHGHDESRGAVAALRSVIIHHCLLHRMEAAARDSFDCDDIAPGHQRYGDETAVERAVARLPFSIAVDNGHGTSAAIAFSATFFG